MHLAPGTPGRNIMFFLMPLVFTVNLQAGAIYYNDAAGFDSFGQQVPWQINAALGNTAEIGDGNIGLHDARQRVHEALGLA